MWGFFEAVFSVLLRWLHLESPMSARPSVGTMWAGRTGRLGVLVPPASASRQGTPLLWDATEGGPGVERPWLMVSVNAGQK